MEQQITDPREEQFRALARKPPEVTIVSDQALDGEECYRDRFNLIYHLGPVLDVIRHPETKTPMAIAIYGDWGSGKTSAMKWLEQLLCLSNEELTAGARKLIRTVWFDPWKYHTKEDVWRGLVAEVIINSIDVDSATIGRVVSAARKFGLFLGRSFIHALAGLKLRAKASVGPKEAGAEVEAEYSLSSIKEILAEYQEAAHPENAYLNGFESELRNWIKDTLGTDERMVVFIDDLDRCMPDIALQVLEALKLYLNTEKLIFVVGVDRSVIDELVRGYYRRLRLSGEKSQNYLAKMFQVEVQLAPRHVQIRGFLGEQLEKVDYWKDLEEAEQDIFQNVILNLSVHNPREVKRLVNSALISAAGFVMLPEISDDQQGISFAQGLQQYFIRRILEKPVYNMADQLRDEPIHSFFQQWSDALRRGDGDVHLSGTTHLSPSTMNADPSTPVGSVIDTPLLDIERLDDVSERMRAAYAPLAEEKTFEPFLSLLRDDDLAELMRIPYPKKKDADVIREMAVSVDDTAPVLRAVARALGKQPFQVRERDHLTVTRLDLSGTDVTDAELGDITALDGLLDLDLSRTRVTDAGLAHLKGPSQLRYLNLADTQLTGHGLRHLSGRAGLQRLWLRNTKVTDQSLAYLSGLAQLQFLDLSYTQITGDGLQHLQGLPELRFVLLSHTPLTDAGLAQLSKLSGLRTLGLDGAEINDHRLKYLETLSGLVVIWLGSNQITDEGIHMLRSAIPGLTVYT